MHELFILKKLILSNELCFHSIFLGIDSEFHCRKLVLYTGIETSIYCQSEKITKHTFDQITRWHRAIQLKEEVEQMFTELKQQYGYAKHHTTAVFFLQYYHIADYQKSGQVLQTLI